MPKRRRHRRYASTLSEMVLVTAALCAMTGAARAFSPSALLRSSANTASSSVGRSRPSSEGATFASEPCSRLSQPQRRRLMDRHTPPPLRARDDSSFSMGGEDDSVGDLTVPEPPADAVVVGAGPAGLLAAIMLAQKLPPGDGGGGRGGGKKKAIRVFDRRPSPPPSPSDESVWRDAAKFYLLGIGHRGQRALEAFDAWEDVKAHCHPAPGRMDWSPDAGPDDGVERIFTDRPCVTEVIAREKLVGCLYEHVRDEYADRIEVSYGYEVTPADFGGGGDGGGGEDAGGGDDGRPVKLSVTQCGAADVARLDPLHMLKKAEDEPDVICDAEQGSFELSANLLVAADGTARTVASAMEAHDRDERRAMNLAQKLLLSCLRRERPFTIKRYVDDNRRVYKTFPMKVPPGWRTDLNYSARSRDGRVTFDALPADGDGNYCGVLLLREDDELAEADTDPAALRALLDEFLPQFSRLMDDETVGNVAKKGPSYLPSFRYAGPRLHQGDRTVILGDCAHTVKPYFGLGANTALEDVQILGEAIESTSNIGEAVRLFSKKRAKESEVLVKLSRGLDHPGTLGTLRFIVPLLVDTLFHKIAPRLFAPNTLSMFQEEGMTFAGIRRRKRLDRMGQCAVLGGVLYGLGTGSAALVKALVSMTGRRGPGAVVTGLAASIVAAGALRRAGFLLLPGLAPADVMPKTQEDKAN